MQSRSHTPTTVSSRDFARDLARAKRAAASGPVFITDRGQPAYALMKIADYYRLTGEQEKSLLDVMDAIPGGDFDFDPPRLQTNSLKSVDLD